MSRIVVITGTSTDVGKTVVTAALAATARSAGARVAVCKPAQTGVVSGEAGDLDAVVALTGPLATAECVRYPDPLAPDTAARRAGMAELRLDQVADAIDALAASSDLVLVEGAGGVLVRLAADLTLLDIAAHHDADVVVVVPAGLGALNHAELTVGAIRGAGLRPAGLVIGSWPADPDLAMTCNRTDLPRVTGVPIVGTVPAGAGAIAADQFVTSAPGWFDAEWISALTIPESPITQGVLR